MEIKYMKYNQSEKGQTVIETALMMIFLLVLFFGMAEIARAWWLKNQLNNAARVAVRVAIVTPTLSSIGSPEPCTSPSSAVAVTACNSITNTALHDSATVDLDVGHSGNAIPGDTVKVTVTGDFVSVVPNLAGLSFGLFPTSLNMTSDASMRYE